ncbi:MAG: hypothetical protein IJY04_07235, partial [Clostridia bacterium]|nr:hypothetical protein [Clostridia bacterium]
MKKRILCLALALTLLFLASCGEYKPAIKDPDATGGDNSSGGEGSGGEGGGADTTPIDDAFTVTLSVNGVKLVPSAGIYAQWTDGFSFHRAEFDAEGIAKIGGLDGDYRVTLSSVPDGYTYDPTAYVVTNDEKSVDIKLYKLGRTSGTGLNLYENIITLNSVGVYRTEFTTEGQVFYYQFYPRESGLYSIESWVDTTANKLNPSLDIYNGSTAYKVFSHTLDDGGVASTYTKNFKYEVHIDDSEIGNVFAFGIKVTAKDGKYPISVDFAVKLDGEFDRVSEQQIMIPTQIRDVAAEFDSSYEFVGAETLVNGHYIFDGSRYGLNPDDGYYHVYNEETGTFDGPILCAYVG